MIQFHNVTKHYPGVTALQDVSFSIKSGSCHAVVGENGAGKSTLGKILAGVQKLDEGTIFVEGMPVRLETPFAALQIGIGIVHQELAFCDNLSIAENLCLGKIPSSATFVKQNSLTAKAEEMMSAIDPDISVHQRLGELSIGRQQMVQIAAAMGNGARIIVFDEPTSSLSHVEAERLFEQIELLKLQGVTCVYISHDMDEIFRLCDEVTVLRDGKHTGTHPVENMDKDRLISMMIGRSLDAYFPAHIEAPTGHEMLRVENLASPDKFHNISFSLKSGEIVGLAGLVGAGRTEVARALFGLDPAATGRIYIDGKQVHIRHPVHAMSEGMGFVPEDRKRYGLVLSMRVQENIALPTIQRMSNFGWIRTAAEESLAVQYIEGLRIRTPSPAAPTAGLSGGNQQKLVLARWLAANCRILIVDEPTRGVDVGAKAEMHALLDRLAAEGSSIILISSELSEILNLSTRILVLRNGEIAGELSRQNADQDSVMRLMTGVPSKCE
jgi:ABC-type sugar transport system ATPase subunit